MNYIPSLRSGLASLASLASVVGLVGLVGGALVTTAAGCSIFDLAELDQAKSQDASAPLADAAGGSDGSVDGSLPPGPADAAGPDAFDDPNIPPGATLGSCDPSKWVASASISHPVNPPSYAIDGLLPTRWSTGAAQSNGQYFQIDFGGYVMVDHVAMNPAYETDGHGDHPRSVDALVSGDGVDFSRRVGGALFGDADPGIATVTWTPHAARYLRLSLNASSGSWWSIHDLQVGCTVPGGMPTPDAGPANPGPDGGFIASKAGWSATALPTNAGDPVTNAFDGSDSTRWASGKTPQYGDEVYRLDLGAVTDISGVQLRDVNTDFPAAYALDVSTDDVTYTNVATGLGAQITSISFHRQPVRYLRVRQIGSGYDHWWGINEIDVVQ